MHSSTKALRARARRSTRFLARALAVLAGVAIAGLAHAALWTYVDESGDVHFASEQVDSRYTLFYKGDLAPAPPAAAAESAPAADVDLPRDPAGERLLQRLTRGQDPARYEKLIEEHAARQELDPALVKAIVAVESGFAPAAISPKGARGLMQVMPETAARYGVTGDRKRSAEQKLLDPAVSVQVGTRYLRDLLVRFAGDVALSVAAYNAGEMAVERYKKRVPPFPETIEYVKRVQQVYAALRPPAPAAHSSPVAATPSLRGRRVHGTFVALQPPAAESGAPAL